MEEYEIEFNNEFVSFKCWIEQASRVSLKLTEENFDTFQINLSVNIQNLTFHHFI